MTDSRWKFVCCWISLLLAASFFSGCKDDTTAPPVDEGTQPFADTREQLMANFKSIYEDMDLAGYKDLLAPNFQMILKTSTAAEFPELGTTLDYPEEMTIAANIFSGANGHDPSGNLQNPISAIAFQDPVPLTPWRLSLPTDPIPNQMSALFDVLFEFNRAGATTMQVRGQIMFYITSHDSLYQGTVKPFYQMLGMGDFTTDGWKNNENKSFSTVKAVFRKMPTTGTVVVAPAPEGLLAPWQLLCPDGYYAAGSGDSTLSDMAIGNYEISWGFKDGWISPPDTSGVLIAGDTIIFHGQYVAGLAFPDTPEQLMRNFKLIYQNMDIEGYRNLLDPHYLTILKRSTTLEYPEVGETLDYTEEVRIQTNMFSGASGHAADGTLQNPVSSIAFQDPVQLTAWEISVPSDPIPNAPNALFDVLFDFNRAGATTLQVTGKIRFYITHRDSLYQGSVKQYYQMLGQWDFTNDYNAQGNVSFGSLKALFR